MMRSPARWLVKAIDLVNRKGKSVALNVPSGNGNGRVTSQAKKWAFPSPCARAVWRATVRWPTSQSNPTIRLQRAAAFSVWAPLAHPTSTTTSDGRRYSTYQSCQGFSTRCFGWMKYGLLPV